MKMILDSPLVNPLFFGGIYWEYLFFLGCRKSANPSGGWDEYLPPRLSPWKLLLSGEVGRGQKDQFLLECVWGPGHPVHPGPPGYILESYGIHVEKFRAENFHIVPIFAIFYNVCITCLSFSACGFCSKSIHRFSRF